MDYAITIMSCASGRVGTRALFSCFCTLLTIATTIATAEHNTSYTHRETLLPGARAQMTAAIRVAAVVFVVDFLNAAPHSQHTAGEQVVQQVSVISRINLKIRVLAGCLIKNVISKTKH